MSKKTKTTAQSEPAKVTTKIVVTQKLSIGTMRPYFVIEMGEEVMYILNDTSVTKLLMNHIDQDQLTQMWSNIDEGSKAVIFKVS